MDGYSVIRSGRKTLSLCVTREGEIVVRAPLSASDGYIAAFVEKHRRWIEKRVLQAASREKLSLQNGDAVTLFGSRYTVRQGRARLAGGEIFLPEEGREEALVRLLKPFSREVMARLTERVAARYGFCYRAVRISSARGRWGSCSRRGDIAYTFRIAFLPPELSEYVAVHELAHTVVFDHSPKFWRVVESILPERKALQKALRAHPAMSYL